MLETHGTFSWGATRPTTQSLVAVASTRDARIPGPCALPYGNGRSYGDSCLNDGGVLLSSKRLDAFVDFDAATGVLTCESGARLDRIIDEFLPRGFFVPITLGTKLITVGGAIANDVHGKNHHAAGTFGHHVLEFELLRSDGTRLVCSPTQNSGWFAATIGGLGLTGFILWAKIRLPRVPGGWVRCETVPFGGIDEFVALSRESERFAHLSAWVDLLNFSRGLGRGILFRGDFAAHDAPLPRAPRATVPCAMPNFLLNRAGMRPFNDLYYEANAQKGAPAFVPYDGFFFPLDGIHGWNKMYGRRGFFQYQCVLPTAAAAQQMPAMLRYLRARKVDGFLGVAKLFGDIPSMGLISFARPGLTLAIDLPNDGARTLGWMDDLDAMTADCGGAVYPAKDARMSRPNFEKFFPNLPRFRPFVDPGLSSDFWKRVGA